MTMTLAERRRERYRTTESVKRQPVMTYVAQKKTFINRNFHQTCIQGLLKSISKLYFK